MLDLQQILQSLHDLSIEEKVVVRDCLNDDLLEAGRSRETGGTRNKSSALVGLFAHDDAACAAIDDVLDDRNRPWRVE